jgi:Kef-type K+ transport system membrane component KefB
MITFNSLLVIGGVAIAVPLLLGLVPAVKVPAVVLEILGGVLVGPRGSRLGAPRFGRPGDRRPGPGFPVVALALVVAYGLQLAGQVRNGLLVAITLMATSLGILVPILKDAGHTETAFGQLTMAAGSLAKLGPLVLLSVGAGLDIDALFRSPPIALQLLKSGVDGEEARLPACAPAPAQPARREEPP